MKVRLHQFLSRTGEFSSKKDALDAIAKGEIKVDGRITSKPHFQFSPKKEVSWKGKRINMAEEKKYFLLNKPEGYLSSRLTDKDKGKKSVFGLVEEDSTLFCIGRLDEDSSGLLIITNDGNLSHNIASPENNIEKTYKVALEKPIEKKEEIEKGIMITLEENWKKREYKTRPCKLKIIDKKEVYITLTEGKKREVKRIFEASGNKVAKLERVGIGRLNLEELKIGKGKYIAVEREFIENRIK